MCPLLRALSFTALNSFRPREGYGLRQRLQNHYTPSDVSVPVRGMGCVEVGVDITEAITVSVPVRGMDCVL